MSNGNQKKKSYEELKRKMCEINRDYSPMPLPYPKLAMRSECCNCNNTTVNQLRVGEPLPTSHVDHCTGYVHFPKPNVSQAKKGCKCGKQEQCTR
ncbi:unnamed protein product [Nezara viridula]|uniref:Uncharacterized protein n=1 Tax=Nezara viridula TaxID=85310 RepID=A0A9P0H9L6_NEZVI|nr:unnamed protein product [Nezara viridula]